MIAIAFLLAALPQEDQPASFLSIHKAAPNEEIAFVHIESEMPELVLGIYSARQQLAVWPPSAEQFEPLTLAPNERFFMDPAWRLLGVGVYKYKCMQDRALLGLAEFTSLRLPKEFPHPVVPDILPPPRPNPPPPVAGACAVHFSEDGSVVVFATTDLELEQPSRLTVFRRDPALDFQYVRTASLVSASQGKVSMSRDGRLIARREGREVIVFGVTGVERARLPLKRSFALALDARWLVRWSSTEATFTPLDESGAVNGNDVVFPTPTPCIEVQLHGATALVRERSTVSLFDIVDRQVGWSRSIAEGHFSSMDLARPTPDRTLVALGRRTTLRAPARRGQGFVAGVAQGTAEVVDAGNDQVLASSTIQFTDWTYDTPRVELVSAPTRLVVTTPQSAQLSTEIL